MSVLRQQNWLGQQRVDIPHIRAVESSICADFDVAMGLIMGGGTPQVVKGFTLVSTGAIGSPATNLQLVVANGIVVHYGASESGSMFWIPSTRANETLNSSNANLTGSFTSGATNYVGLDLIRTADSTTSDNVQFLDANTLVELSRTVPLGRTINYRLVVSLTPFSSSTNICPIAKVVTDANNNVTSIVDARQMLWRLGTGSDTPATKFTYAWGQGRNELTAVDPFQGGDKAFGSFSDFKQGVLTRLWELGGGEYWYSPATDRYTRLIGEGAALATGDYFSWDGLNLTWQNLFVLFGGSTGYYNTVVSQAASSSGLTNLAIGECVYVDLDRTQNATVQPVKAALSTLGSPTVPGARFVLAWRSPAGNVFARDRSVAITNSAPSGIVAATSTVNGIVELSTTAPGSSTNPRAATLNASSLAACAGLIRDASSTPGIGTLTYLASIATSGSAVGHILDNSTSLTTSGDKLVSVRNAGTEKIYVDKDGNLTGGGTGTFTLFPLSPNQGVSVRGNKLPGDTGTDLIVGGASGTTRSGGLLIDVQNNATSKFALDFNGKIKAPTGIVVGSAILANGTITVSTSAVTSSSLIFLTRGQANLTSAAGVVSVGTITAGTSFVINSITAGGTAVQAGDQATVNWWIVN